MEHRPAGTAAGATSAAGMGSAEADAAERGGEPPHAGIRDHADGRDHRGVALLLGAAAICAAIVGARAAGLSSDASDAWQSALRTEVKRATGALEDIRYVYQSEVPIGVTILGLRAQRDAYTAAASADPANAPALTLEAQTQANVLAAMETSSELATSKAYALPGGGLDLGRRLADVRAQDPALVALDPDAIERQGNALASRARFLLLALLPLGACALLGTLAQAFARVRTPLLAAGAVLLGAGVTVAVVSQVLG